MKLIKSILLLFFTLFVLPGCIHNGQEKELVSNETVLPYDFTVYLFSDATSSGGTRNGHSYVTFHGDEVVAANRSSYSDSRSGVNYCNDYFIPASNNWSIPNWSGPYAEWLKENNEKPNPCFADIFLNRTQFEEAINSNELVPLNGRCLYTTCYKIIE